MANLQSEPTRRSPEANPKEPSQERRTQPRSNTVLSRIEDMTYEILRKYEKKSA